MDLITLPQLDLETARARLLDDDEILRSLLGSVLPSIQPNSEKLSRALFAGDLSQAKIHAHGMRGVLSGAGADRLVQRLRRLETNLHTLPLSASVAQLEAIAQDCREVELLIKDYLDTPLKS